VSESRLRALRAECARALDYLTQTLADAKKRRNTVHIAAGDAAEAYTSPVLDDVVADVVAFTASDKAMSAAVLSVLKKDAAFARTQIDLLATDGSGSGSGSGSGGDSGGTSGNSGGSGSGSDGGIVDDSTVTVTTGSDESVTSTSPSPSPSSASNSMLASSLSSSATLRSLSFPPTRDAAAAAAGLTTTTGSNGVTVTSLTDAWCVRSTFSLLFLPLFLHLFLHLFLPFVSAFVSTLVFCLLSSPSFCSTAVILVVPAHHFMTN
jgi:hypothetical protein